MYDASRSEAFLDTVKIISSAGVAYAVNKPTEFGSNPVFGSASYTWDRDVDFNTVLYDTDWPVESRYRMWYEGLSVAGGVYDAMYTCYAYSADGVTWTKPNLGLISYGGNTNNNILLAEHHLGLGMAYYGGVYYMMVGVEVSGSPCQKIYTSTNPTGPWTLQKNISEGVGDTFPMGMGLIRRDDGRWLAYGQCDPDLDGVREINVWLSDTTDITGDWTDYGDAIHSVDGDAQLYSIGIQRHGELYYGFVPIFNNTTQKVWMALYISRDGITWTQKDASWIPNGAGWNSGMIYDGETLIKLGNTWRYYHSGATGVHDAVPPVNDYIGYATIGYGRIGQISGASGNVVVVAITTGNKTLHINADASGGGKIETELINGVDGTVLTGYAQADADDIATDTYDTEVTWGGLSLPGNLCVKIKFYLTDAVLYSYWLE